MRHLYMRRKTEASDKWVLLCVSHLLKMFILAMTCVLGE